MDRSRKRPRSPSPPPPPPPIPFPLPLPPEDYPSPSGRDEYGFSEDTLNNNRYKIIHSLGEGACGFVKLCFDTKEAKSVAIKISRPGTQFYDMAVNEIHVLQELAKFDTDGRHFVQLIDSFDSNDRKCLVLEKLGPQLSDLMKKQGASQVPLPIIRDFARQLLESIEIIHRAGFIHVDLKPDNLLLLSLKDEPDSKSSSYEQLLPRLSTIKVIDFGIAKPSRGYDCEPPYHPYCAPEFIVDGSWDSYLDVWNAGCILLELCSGVELFRGADSLERIELMEKVLGKLPSSMSSKLSARVDITNDLNATSERMLKVSLEHRPLKELVKYTGDKSRDDLVELIKGLLMYVPSERLTAGEALKHLFFTKEEH